VPDVRKADWYPDARRLVTTSAAGWGEKKSRSMGSISGPEVPARGTGPIRARHTAGGPTTSRADQNVPDIQPPGTDQQLADAVNSNVKTTTADGHASRDVEAPEHRDEKPANTESSVREGKRPGLEPDSGYGPSLRTDELDTPKQRLTYSEVPHRPCGRRDEAEVCTVCYTIINFS